MDLVEEAEKVEALEDQHPARVERNETAVAAARFFTPLGGGPNDWKPEPETGDATPPTKAVEPPETVLAVPVSAAAPALVAGSAPAAEDKAAATAAPMGWETTIAQLEAMKIDDLLAPESAAGETTPAPATGPPDPFYVPAEAIKIGKFNPETGKVAYSYQLPTSEPGKFQTVEKEATPEEMAALTVRSSITARRHELGLEKPASRPAKPAEETRGPGPEGGKPIVLPKLEMQAEPGEPGISPMQRSLLPQALAQVKAKVAEEILPVMREEITLELEEKLAAMPQERADRFIELELRKRLPGRLKEKTKEMEEAGNEEVLAKLSELQAQTIAQWDREFARAAGMFGEDADMVLSPLAQAFHRVIVQGQTPRTAAEALLLKIGDNPVAALAIALQLVGVPQQVAAATRQTAEKTQKAMTTQLRKLLGGKGAATESAKADATAEAARAALESQTAAGGGVPPNFSPASMDVGQFLPKGTGAGGAEERAARWART